MKEKRILHLTLKKIWFELIARGVKKTEYREIKPYWEKRFLMDNPNTKFSRIIKTFDEIHFKNGYTKHSSFMRVKWKGLDLEMYKGKLQFAIKLGKIIEEQTTDLNTFGSCITDQNGARIDPVDFYKSDEK